MRCEVVETGCILNILRSLMYKGVGKKGDEHLRGHVQSRYFFSFRMNNTRACLCADRNDTT